MNRREFLNNACQYTAYVGLYSLSSLSMLHQSVDLSIQTLSLKSHSGQDIRIHALPTGTVKVKKSHRGWGNMASILLDFRWTEALPIYTWVVEHPEGLLVIDSGENARVTESDYFDCDPTTGWVNQKILRFEIAPQLEIGPRMATLGLKTADVRWLVLTHMHLDHVDGLHYFPHAEVLIAQNEWQNPYGAVKCLLPKWLKPHLLQHQSGKHSHLGPYHQISQAGDLFVVPTPGHTRGHQSVVLKTPELDVFFAGDCSFSQEQLLNGAVAGICADKRKAKETYQKILAYAKEQATLYLPSHDIQSGIRLAQKSTINSFI